MRSDRHAGGMTQCDERLAMDGQTGCVTREGCLRLTQTKPLAFFAERARLLRLKMFVARQRINEVDAETLIKPNSSVGTGSYSLLRDRAASPTVWDLSSERTKSFAPDCLNVTESLYF